MKIGQLTYTPGNPVTSGEKHNTYVLVVDEVMYDKYHAGDTTIPISNIVDSFEIMRYELPGRSGKLVHPSKRELSDDFGMTNEDALVAYMLANGKKSKHLR